MASLLDALRGFFNPPPGFEPSEPLDRVVMYGEERSSDPFGSEWETISGGSTTGEQVTVDSALTAIAVQAAVRLLVNDIGSLPVDVFRRTDRGKQAVDKPSWLLRPSPSNPNLTWDDHVKQVVFSILTDGNAFVYCFPSAMRPVEVRALSPASVDLRSVTGSTDAEYKVEGAERTLTPREVLHIPWMLQPGRGRGLNPIENAKQGLGIALAADKFVGSYFGNGAILSGVIEFPQGTDPSAAQIKGIKDDFKRKHIGARKSHAVGALTGGATFKPFDYNNRNAQLLELRDAIVEDVARLFGIPPHMLGSQKPGAVGYASVEQRSIDYVQHAILPIVSRIEKGYNRLLGGDDLYIKFNLNGLLRADSQARATFYREMLGSKVIAKEEVRALEDLSPLAGAEGFLETPNNNAADPRIVDVGALIRAGFDPAEALVAVGLPPIKHTGLVPVTVQGENVATETAPEPERSLQRQG